MKEFKLEKHASLSAYISGFCTTLWGGLTLEKFGIMVGIATSLGTFAVNLYYKRKEAKRREKALG